MAFNEAVVAPQSPAFAFAPPAFAFAPFVRVAKSAITSEGSLFRIIVVHVEEVVV